MQSAREIMGEIASYVAARRPNYNLWTIGVTDDAQGRRYDHGSPPDWETWNPRDEHDAREIEAHFISLGMNGGAGGPGSADVVYVFRGA